jgi:hypothetical protein
LSSNLSLLQNETAFDSLFCDKVDGVGFSIYYNPHFWDDPIFNHVIFSSSVLDSENFNSLELDSSFEEIIERTRKIQIPATLYVDRFWRNSKSLEKNVIDFGFMIIEQMHILKKAVRNPESVEATIEVTGTEDTNLWKNAFVKSFGIPETWIKELEGRLEQIVKDRKTILLVAMEKGFSEASGCSLIHIDPADCMGVYCVGTIPERRSHGVARALMVATEIEALERKCHTLVLQTLASDGVAPMYFKMGYDTAFERDVLQFRE